ncbi:MAG: S-adenosyl-l-methionine hydroxide adenosyltransferase family protein [Sulfurifustis sp.]
MIVLYTDYGIGDPYVGQLHAVLARDAPGVAVIDLLHAVPDFDIRAGAYLLAALAAEFPDPCVFVGVVDPGVGSERAAVIVHADRRWYVGPDNGLFHVVARRASHVEVWRIDWRPERLSASFHGRDLFAPVAAMLARGDWPRATPVTLTPPDGEWPEDLAQIIYIDHFGNGMTGLRAANVDRRSVFAVAGTELRYAPVFSAAAPGIPFWYENSIGLVEIAVHTGSAGRALGLRLGLEVGLLDESGT